MKPRGQAGSKLCDFIDDIGIPDRLIADQAGEQYGSNTVFQDAVRRNRIQMKWLEKGRHTQSHTADREIGNIRQQ